MKVELAGNPKAKEKKLAYDRISDTWESFVSRYDEERRVEVLVDDFLGKDKIFGKNCLDAGCGLGYFSQAFLKYGPARLCACDVSAKLVNKLKVKVPGIHCFVGDILELPVILDGETFDVVLCSDVIEHIDNPRLAVKKLTEIVSCGGLLAISVPNRKWKWLLNLAILAGLRKNYEGCENYVFPSELKKWIEEEKFKILRCEGVHTIPFKLFPKKLLRILDKKFRNFNYSFSFNLAILARKERG